METGSGLAVQVQQAATVRLIVMELAKGVAG